MSDTADIDYTLWEAYLAECKFLGIKADLSDYLIYLQEADMDRTEDWEPAS